MITLTIPEATPSLNTMMRRHWSVDMRLKKRWRQMVMVAACGKMPKAALNRARITITRFSPRMLDADNCTGGAKHCIDGLKWCGIIADDTPEHIELTVRQEKGKAQTRIELEPLT